MPDAIDKTLAHIEREIADDKLRTHDSADRLYELDCDTREDIRKLWRDHSARVAPLLAQRASIVKALVQVKSIETAPPVIVPSR